MICLSSPRSAFRTLSIVVTNILTPKCKKQRATLGNETKYFDMNRSATTSSSNRYAPSTAFRNYVSQLERNQDLSELGQLPTYDESGNDFGVHLSNNDVNEILARFQRFTQRCQRSPTRSARSSGSGGSRRKKKVRPPASKVAIDELPQAWILPVHREKFKHDTDE